MYIVRRSCEVQTVETVECHVARLDTHFAQWSADNVDHNIVTLDGRNTFHGMGVIVSVATTNENLVAPLPQIQRKSRIPVMELTHDKGIPITPFEKPLKSGLSALVFADRSEIALGSPTPSEIIASNTLWHLGWLRGSEPNKHPNWSGYMQMIKGQEIPETSDIHLLPIIDMDPTSETCIHSTLLYVMKQAQQIGLPTPCITFDQPLWLKAVSIAKSGNLDVVIRLGGFHTLMSFLGSIGAAMAGSGIEEVLGEIYAENTVPHLLSGKAIARALRGHFIVHAALMRNLFKRVFDEMDASEVEEVKLLLDGVSSGSTTRVEIADSKLLNDVWSKVENLRKEIALNSETAQLWLQYANEIEVVKLFIVAERVGDWNLHLVAIDRMLNLFAATGHLHYAKCGRLYLQLMQDLPNSHPWLYKKFAEEGCHAIRRSKRYWSGLWSDLVIEQVMMKSLKSRGGLTTGRGMTESVRHQWVHSMHRCSSIHHAMTVLTNLATKSSEQHEELGNSRCKRDHDDVAKVVEWFNQHDPFDPCISGLRSLSTGITAMAADGINCHIAEEVGENIQKKLDGVVFPDAKIKRSEKVRTLATLYGSVAIGKDDKIALHPTVLFTRLVAIAQREEDVSKFFKFELSPEPASLFKNGSMRKADKSQLRKMLADHLTCETLPDTDVFVLDGGALLHKVKWVNGETYKQIVQRYVQMVKKKYGQCCVVFDGYGKPCTKRIMSINGEVRERLLVLLL